MIAIVRELPKPIAAFSCSIEHAVELHDAAVELGLSIPGEMAIVTVMQDQAQSKLTDISLSSLTIDYDRQAYEAAAVLDRMMEGETSKPINLERAVELRNTRKSRKGINNPNALLCSI